MGSLTFSSVPSSGKLAVIAYVQKVTPLSGQEKFSISLPEPVGGSYFVSDKGVVTRAGVIPPTELIKTPSAKPKRLSILPILGLMTIAVTIVVDVFKQRRR